MTFLFAVLGSVMFWIGYVFITVFIGTLLFKHLMPVLYNGIISGWSIYKFENKFDEQFSIIVACIICLYLFWPVLLIIVIFKFILKILWKTFWKFFTKTVIKIDQNLPEISFKKKEEEK
jgi:hypothetical protein